MKKINWLKIMFVAWFLFGWAVPAKAKDKVSILMIYTIQVNGEDVSLPSDPVVNPGLIGNAPPAIAAPSAAITPAPAPLSIKDKITLAVTNAWNETHVSAIHALVASESGFNPYAVNPRSGACGLPQSLPCAKLLNACGKLDNIDCQINWLVSYIKRRYGDPSRAWRHWQSRVRINGRDVGHWY